MNKHRLTEYRFEIDDPQEKYTFTSWAQSRPGYFPRDDHSYISEYDPAFDGYQPQVSAYIYRRGSIYDQPWNYPLAATTPSVDYYRHHEEGATPPSSEIELVMDRLGGTNPSETNAKTSTAPKRTTRRQLLNNLFDFIAIAATCLIFGLIYLLVKPYQGGFFCDDTSIQYPYKPDTIPMWLLAVYGGLGPVIIFLIVELWVVRPFNCGRRGNQNTLKQRQIDYIKTIFQTIFLFGLGIAICFLITEVGKRTIGRLRPYYITICNPIWANINCTRTVQTASGSVIISQYVLDHQCNTTASATELREAKLSFPSGHSSYSTFAFVFLFVYFEARLVCPNIQFLKPFLQCLCIAVAFFTCLSRVTDYKHHPTDVIGGAIIGFCIAVFAAIRVGTYLWSFSVYCETEEETAKDQLPKDERVPVPGLDSRQNGTLRETNDMPLETLSNRRQQRDNPMNYQSDFLHSTPGQAPNGYGTRRIVPSNASPDATL